MKYRINHKVLKAIVVSFLYTTFIQSAVQEHINSALVAIDAQVNQIYGAVAGSKAVIEELVKQNRMLQQALAQKEQQQAHVAPTAPSAPSQTAPSGPHTMPPAYTNLLSDNHALSSANKKLEEEKRRWIVEREKLIADREKRAQQNQAAGETIKKLVIQDKQEDVFITQLKTTNQQLQQENLRLKQHLTRITSERTSQTPRP